MQARSIRRGPSSSSLSVCPQGGRQTPLTLERLLPWHWKAERLPATVEA